MKDWHVLAILVLALLILLRSKNEETWTWTDYRGFTYQVRADRHVHS